MSSFDFIAHAVFTRYGGFSQGKYSSLNLSYDVGDKPQQVTANLQVVQDFLGAENLIFSRQSHKNRVKIIKDKLPDKPIIGYDALVTNRPYTALLVKLADCQGILLCDACKKVIAAVHCGWRGSVLNIIGQTLKGMEEVFGCHPQDIWAAISPSLGPCCAEFKDYKQLLPKWLWKYKINKCHFDWWKVSKHQLMAAGVPESQIEIAGICTVCDQRFFSYRRDGRHTGRFGAAIMLKEA